MAVMPTRVKAVGVVWALALAAGLLMLTLLANPAQAQAQTDTFNEVSHTVAAGAVHT